MLNSSSKLTMRDNNFAKFERSPNHSLCLQIFPWLTTATAEMGTSSMSSRPYQTVALPVSTQSDGLKPRCWQRDGISPLYQSHTNRSWNHVPMLYNRRLAQQWKQRANEETEPLVSPSGRRVDSYEAFDRVAHQHQTGKSCATGRSRSRSRVFLMLKPA
jgi:hypothetical protein